MLVSALILVSILLGFIGVLFAGVLLQRMITKNKRKAKKVEQVKNEVYKSTRELIKESENFSTKSTHSVEETKIYTKKIDRFFKKMRLAEKYKIDHVIQKNVLAVYKALKNKMNLKPTLKSNKVLTALRTSNLISKKEDEDLEKTK